MSVLVWVRINPISGNWVKSNDQMFKMQPIGTKMITKNIIKGLCYSFSESFYEGRNELAFRVGAILS